VFDVCVVGGGPAGLFCTLLLHQSGLRVLLLEAGGRVPIPGSPELLAGRLSDVNAHGPTDLVSAAALGGTSHWWGGRVVPFDPADFRTWPVSREELLPWYQKAAEMLGCPGALERPAPKGFDSLSDFDATHSEMWAHRRNLGRHWAHRLISPDGPALLLGARVVGMTREGSRIASLRVLIDGQQREAKANRFIIAGGGLASVRLMLAAQRKDPALFGGPGGPLGRGYMGHLTGSISDLVFERPADADAFGFQDGGRYFSRRRILPRIEAVNREDICNVAFWIEGPKNSDPSHGSAASSARFLAASAVRLMAGKRRPEDLTALGPHMKIAASAPLSAVGGLSQAAWGLAMSRIARQGFRPRRFPSAGGGGWRMVYHAEQKPDPENRIGLLDENDSAGMPKLDINFRFSEADAESVVRAHTLLDADLRASGAGSLRFTSKNMPPAVLVRTSARDGFHQLGGANMSVRPSDGVVDRNCDVHGLDNLSVISSCVFPTGGQANPTFTIMALAYRLSDRLARAHKAAYAAATAVTAGDNLQSPAPASA
jgi:choline dehydrogenase-like flavoprotein